MKQEINYEVEIKKLYYSLFKELQETHDSFEFLDAQDIEDIIHSIDYMKKQFILNSLENIIKSLPEN